MGPRPSVTASAADVLEAELVLLEHVLAWNSTWCSCMGDTLVQSFTYLEGAQRCSLSDALEAALQGADALRD